MEEGIELDNIVVMTASRSVAAQRLKSFVGKKYGFFELSATTIEKIKACTTAEKRAMIIVFGGDGYMLHVMNRVITAEICDKVFLYGINCGNVGFLMNSMNQRESLAEEIGQSVITELPVLQATCFSLDKNKKDLTAINEVAILRACYQTAHLRVKINGVVRVDNLIGDGIIISTATGSAAYNKSAGGLTLPLSSKLLSITSVNPFRPRGWKSAIISDDSVIEIEAINPHGRGINLHADSKVATEIQRAIVSIDKTKKMCALFRADEPLAEKLLIEQFH